MKFTPKDKIYHEDKDELSKNNLKIIKNIESNKDIELANQLLAQAYLFLNTFRLHSLSKNLIFSCYWCNGCVDVDGYGCDSKYCLHGNDCELSKFIIDKLEKSFKESIKNEPTS